MLTVTLSGRNDKLQILLDSFGQWIMMVISLSYLFRPTVAGARAIYSLHHKLNLRVI